MGAKLLNGIKSMYVSRGACVRVKGDESESFRINSGVRQGCIHVPFSLQCIYDAVRKKNGDGGRGECDFWRREER